MQNLEKIMTSLMDGDVQFILIGGFAAVVHGVSITTQDIDLCILFEEANLTRLLHVLKDTHPLHRSNRRPLTEPPSALARFKNLYLLTDLGSLDLLGEVRGIGTFSDLSPHAIGIELFGRTCNVLDIDALIRSKQAMARPKDKQVVAQLLFIREQLKDPKRYTKAGNLRFGK